MPEIIKQIKDLAHKVSEEYLLFGKDMNNELIQMYQNGEIQNDEVLKRVCEHANQNVYLGLFNDPSINKSNIVFKIADFNTIIPIIRESETAMNSLNTAPEDFRKDLASIILSSESEKTASVSTETSLEKQAALNTAIYYKNAVKDFMDKVALMKSAEEGLAEEAFNKMAHDAKIIVAKGDSFGDLSKIAARSIKEKGGDFMKIAQAYDLILKDLNNNNYSVDTEFTKISSMHINHNSEVLRPVHILSDSIMKIAALEEMRLNLSHTFNTFDSAIKKELKNV